MGTSGIEVPTSLVDMGIPHLAVPFQIVNGSVATVDQDSVDEIAQCVQAIVTTPLGSRVEMPAFGVPNPVLTQDGSVPATTMLAAVRRWEPRAAAVITDGVSSIADLIRQISVKVDRVNNVNQ